MHAAVITEDRRLELAAVEERPLGPGEVRIEVAACGVCGSDLHLLKAPESLPFPVPAGFVLGHEFSGTVAELGADVDGWAVGDPVAVYPHAPCGRCIECRAGHPQVCVDLFDAAVGLTQPGAYAETCVVRASMLARIPAQVPIAHGALAEPLAVGLHGVGLAKAQPESTVAVLGGGPIGIMAALGMRARGVDRVVLVEPQPLRRELAERIGFAAVGLEGGARAVYDALDGDAPTIVLECAGHPSSVGFAIELARPLGRIVLYSLPYGPVPLPQTAVVTKELELVGVGFYIREEYDDALALVASGQIPVGDIVTSILPLAEAQTALDAIAASGTRELKILLAPR